MSQPPATHTGEEEVVWKGSVSHWHYAGRWFFVFLLLSALIATFFWQPGATVHDQVSLPESPWGYLWPARGILAAIALILIISVQVDRSRRKYTVTNRRVSVEFGWVDKRSNEIRLQDIRSINLLRSGLAGLFGIGRVEFASAAADDAEVIFWNTADAEKVRDLVRSLQGHSS